MAKKEKGANKDMKKQTEHEKKEMDKKLKAWNNKRQQLLEEIQRLSNLQEAKEEIRRKDDEIASLQFQLSAAEKKHEEVMAASKELKKECTKAEEDTTKRDRQSLRVLKKDTERTRAPESSELKSFEERWQKEVSHLKELLTVKNTELSKAHEKREAATKAHMAELKDKDSALKQDQVQCETLREQLKQLTERDESHQRELSQAAESLKKALTKREENFKNELTQIEEGFSMKLTEREESFRRELLEKEESFKKALSERDERLSQTAETFKKELLEKEETLKKELFDRDEKFKKDLTEREENFLRELSEKVETMRKLLSEKEESFQLELSQSLIASKEEFSKLSESWEKKAQQQDEEKRQLEEIHVVKEKIWSHMEADMKEDINLLKQENIQLQLKMENKNTNCLWSCFHT